MRGERYRCQQGTPSAPARCTGAVQELIIRSSPAMMAAVLVRSATSPQGRAHAAAMAVSRNPPARPLQHNKTDTPDIEQRRNAGKPWRAEPIPPGRRIAGPDSVDPQACTIDAFCLPRRFRWLDAQIGTADGMVSGHVPRIRGRLNPAGLRRESGQRRVRRWCAAAGIQVHVPRQSPASPCAPPMAGSGRTG